MNMEHRGLLSNNSPYAAGDHRSLKITLSGPFGDLLCSRIKLLLAADAQVCASGQVTSQYENRDR